MKHDPNHKSKFLRFAELRETTPAGLDGHRYRLSFEVGERRGEAFHVMDRYSFDIEASRTLQAVWNRTDAEMAIASGTSASSYVLGLARESRLNELQTLKLNTYSAPKEPPTAPIIKEGTMLAVASAPAALVPRTYSLLSEDISELRDHINALAKDLWGGRVLLLSQERPLLDMYKSVRDAEDFRARIQSLGIITKDLDSELLRKVGRVTDSGITGEFVLLQRALESLVSSNEAEGICSVLKQVNNLRQGYPTHGDNAKKFLDAHRFFKQPYPITDFEFAWESVLGRYFDAMRSMRSAMSNAWNMKRE